MAFGIKEVADVKFYPVGTTLESIEATESAATPDFVLDTLKVSNIEMTAEQAEARGGKGNPALIVWDYGKEITLTLEDAVFTNKTLKALLGTDGEVASESGAADFEVKPDSFPGNYTIYGSTFAKDESGVNHVFTFYIPKAKLTPETTITMEADGDPTVFNFTLKVLRNGADGAMITFKKKD